MILLEHFTKQQQTKIAIKQGTTWRNSSVFRRNTLREGESLTKGRRVFQAQATATENESSPRVLQRVTGTSKFIASVDRRRRHPSVVDDSSKDSAMYAGGAVPWSQMYANTHTQAKSNYFWHFWHSQPWSSSRSIVIRSVFYAAKIRRAAALRTVCS